MKFSKKYSTQVTFFIMMLCIVFVYYVNMSLSGMFDTGADFRFLYNRVYNMYSCIKNGIFPFFYYSDLDGLGYGTSFYYPDFTLIPFIWTVPFGFETFCPIFTTTCLIFIYFGVSFFAKRFTENYNFIALVLLCNYSIYFLVIQVTLPCNLYAYGFLFYLMGYAVDFFRNKKHLYELCLFWFLLVNTHPISAVLGVVFCGVCLLMYFDKRQIKQYAKVVILCCISALYFFVNFMYHLSTVCNITLDPKVALTRGFTLMPIGGIFEILCYSAIDYELVLGFGMLSVHVCVFCTVFLIERIKNKNLERKEIIYILLFALFYECGTGVMAWFVIGNKIPILKMLFYPTPFRLVNIALVFMFIICFRYAKHTKLVGCLVTIVSSIEIVCCFLFMYDLVNYNRGAIIEGSDVSIFENIISGEYITRDMYDLLGETTSSDDFTSLDDTDIKRAYSYVDGKTYTYSIDKNKLMIAVNSQDKVKIPKIWYNGYVAYGSNGEKVNILHDKYQFVVLDTQDYSGVVTVYYNHPFPLKLVMLLSILCDCYIVYMVYKVRKNNKARIETFVRTETS